MNDGPTRCLKCGCRDLRVIRTETLATKVRRRRECRHCGRRIWTTEVVEIEQERSSDDGIEEEIEHEEA